MKIIDIIKKYEHAYFISPHYDDAILSAGNLLHALSKILPVSVVTVFTEIGMKPYTLSEKAFMRQCGYKDLKNLYVDRKNENAKILDQIGINRIDFGYVESLSRKSPHISDIRKALSSVIPEFNRLYPTYRFHSVSGKIASSDNETIGKIKSTLIDTDAYYHTNHKNSRLLVCPLGIGGNVDHLIVRTACAGSGLPVIYWTDFPYILKDKPDNKFLSDNNLTPLSYESDNTTKHEMIRQYTTQFMPLFKNKPIKFVTEEYYVKL